LYAVFFLLSFKRILSKTIEGLQLKSLSEFASIEDARSHIEKRERMISSDVMRVLMFNAGLYDWFMSQTEGLAKVAADNVRSGGEFNFMPSHALYLGPLLDDMITTHTDQSEQLTALKAACLSYSVKETNPYENVSEYEWALNRGVDIPTKPIKYEGGYAFITLKTDSPDLHNPQILKPVNGQLMPVGNFRKVKGAGKYSVACPAHSGLVVHDYYGAM